MTFLKPSPSLLLELPGTKQKQKKTPILNYFVLKLFSIESEEAQKDNLQRKREHEKIRKKRLRDPGILEQCKALVACFSTTAMAARTSI